MMVLFIIHHFISLNLYILENDKQNDDDPMDLYSKYYDKETGEITKSFREVINSIEDEIKKEMIKKLKSQKNQKSSNKKEFTSILNPWENIKMFSKINSQWRQLFKQHDLFQEIEQIDSLTKSVQFISENPPKPPFDKPPQPILGFFRNKKLDDEENEFFQKMTDKLVVIRYYNQKLEDSNSFYRAVGFAYLEQLVSEDNPFQSLHKFITSLKSKGTFEMMNPISPNTSFNPNFSLDFKSWSTYIIDLLMRMAGNMWTCVEVSEKDPEKMIEELQVLFNENSAFQLGIVLLLRQEGFEKAKQFENYEDCKKNLSEIDAPPTRRVFKTIAKVLKVRLQIFDFDNPSEEPFDFEPTKIDSNLNPIFLVKYKKVYNIGYSKKFSRSRFPKAYQLNSERKQNLCCSCNINEGKKYNKCQDNYCIECLNKILNEMKDVQMAKCPKCRQVLGNRGHLLTESQIKINKN